MRKIYILQDEVVINRYTPIKQRMKQADRQLAEQYQKAGMGYKPKKKRKKTNYRFKKIKAKQIKNIKSNGKGFYRSKEWLELRQKVLKRDGYKCVECSDKKFLHVHHSKYRFKSNAIEDLITLCRLCHSKKHKLMGQMILKNK